MLSAIVLAPRPQGADLAAARTDEAVARSLSALVGAAVADIVRDACVVGPQDRRLERIADYAGCGLACDEDPRRALEQALRSTRGDCAFVLEAGYAPLSGFNDEISDWLMAPAQPPAALRREPDGFLRRLLPGLSPCAGIVARKAHLLASTGADAQALARALRAATLRARARRVL